MATCVVVVVAGGHGGGGGCGGDGLVVVAVATVAEVRRQRTTTAGRWAHGALLVDLFNYSFSKFFVESWQTFAVSPIFDSRQQRC